MAEKQNTEPTPEEKMDAWTKRMDDMCDRMDAFMAKHSSKKDKRGDGMGAEEGEPAEMASDDDRADEGTDDPSTDIEDRLPPYARRKMADAAHENQLLEAQTKADAVARHWGKRAPMAMMGEPVRVYRRRSGLDVQAAQPELREGRPAAHPRSGELGHCRAANLCRCDQGIERQQRASARSVA